MCIYLRPEAVNERVEIGHGEGDSIVGRGRLNGLHTEYERVTSVIRFERLTRINADETLRAMRTIFDLLPAKLKRSTTLDNGSEMVRHAKLKKTGMKTYFADPYSAWQRGGGNENTNMWIRCYFPKGTDFSRISEEELKDVEWELDNRRRKSLKFKTPESLFAYLNG